MESAESGHPGKLPVVACEGGFPGTTPLVDDFAESEASEEEQEEEKAEGSLSPPFTTDIPSNCNTLGATLDDRAHAAEESEAKTQGAAASAAPPARNSSANTVRETEVKRKKSYFEGCQERKSKKQLGECSVPATASIDGRATPATPGWVAQKQSRRFHVNSAVGNPVTAAASICSSVSRSQFSASDNSIAQKQNRRTAQSRENYHSLRSKSCVTEEDSPAAAFVAAATTLIAASSGDDDWIARKKKLRQALKRGKCSSPRSASSVTNDDDSRSVAAAVSSTPAAATSADNWIAQKQNPGRRLCRRNSNTLDTHMSASSMEGNRHGDQSNNVASNNNLPDAIAPGAVAMPFPMTPEEVNSCSHRPRNSFQNRLARHFCRTTGMLTLISHSSQQLEMQGSVVMEVTAELAPGEMDVAADVQSTEQGDVSQWRGGGGGSSTLVLDGVPLPSRDHTRGLEGSTSSSGGMNLPCFPSRQQNRQLCTAIMVIVIASVVAVAVALGAQWRTTSQRKSGAEIKDPLLNILERLSSPEALNDTQSPQGRALRWLKEDGKFSVSSSVQLPVHDPQQLLQRYTLAVLYYTTGGPTSWSEQLGFLSSDHECQWQHEGKGVVLCNNSGKILVIRLNGNNLTGTLPSAEFAAFPLLEELSLSQNELKATIPSELTALQSLQILDMRDNALSGPLMENIGDMQTLRYLDAAYNNLNSTIPLSIGNLEFLEVLRLETNNLRGTIPDELAALGFLREISLGKNDLSGTLIEHIGDLQQLVYLDLSFNRINSMIPISIGNLSLLKHLDFRANQFSGPIPSTIGNMSSLEVLHLSMNNLASTIPPSWTSLDRLVEFSLSVNKLSGTIPTRPFRTQKLQSFMIGGNRLTGTIPPALGTFPELRYLNIHGNQLHGDIPESLANLTKLVVLWSGSNNLVGTLPSDIFRLKSLRGIDFGENNLDGSLPPEVGNPNRMISISLEMNQFTGTIPPAYGNLTSPSLLGISLHSNFLSGTIPAMENFNKESLFLALENNMLTGSIPTSVGMLNRMFWLSLARNDLTGDIGFLCPDVSEMSGTRLITADCDPPNAEVRCECCQFCCNDAVGTCDYHLDTTTYAKGCLKDGSCNFFGLNW